MGTHGSSSLKVHKNPVHETIDKGKSAHKTVTSCPDLSLLAVILVVDLLNDFSK